jgi:hypothetical protein
MSYSRLSHLIAVIAAAGSLSAQAYPANNGPDSNMAAAPTSARAAGSPGLVAPPSLSPVSTTDISADVRDTKVKLAAVSSTSEILGAIKAQKTTLAVQQVELKGWMLVLIGGFLIWTMSQRRIRSIFD